MPSIQDKQAIKIEQVLSQFPGPVTLYPSRIKLALLTLGGLLFVAAGIWMIRSNAQDWKMLIFGWSSAFFFGLCAVVACLQLLVPSFSSLTLDRDQFTVIKYHQRRVHSWRDAADFALWQFRATRMVIFDTRSETSALKGLNTMISGKNAGLPDTYGFKAETLAEIMNRWRERALRG